MKTLKIYLALTLIIMNAACSTRISGGTEGGLSTSGGANTGAFLSATGSNVMSVSVDNCGANQIVNEPCVSVTICVPGTTTCQTINDILLDTGSFGLRIFHQALSINLPASTAGSNVGECAQFGIGNDWGSVATADIYLAGEPKANTAVQIINSTYENVSTNWLNSNCPSPDVQPSDVGYNGILGVGLFVQDCGDYCDTSQGGTANNSTYFSCAGAGTCTGISMPIAAQISNPIAFLPVDNNGIILTLPGVTPGVGAGSLTGTAIIGIGTESNNVVTNTTTYPADGYANFITYFNGIEYNESFIDSGSNGLYVPAPVSMPQCDNSGPYSWLCPSGTQSLSATNYGYNGSPGGVVSFYLSNANNLFNTGNAVFSDLGASGDSVQSGSVYVNNPNSTTQFDWGLPFFMGKVIAIGLEGGSSSLGTGPYWAY